MSNKRINMGVLPDGFLIEISSAFERGWQFKLMNETYREMLSHPEMELRIRPMTHYWHFNDGSMVLPKGLVVEKRYSDHDLSKAVVGEHSLAYCSDRKLYVVAVKIIGAHPDYAQHAKELGMKVIEI